MPRMGAIFFLGSPHPQSAGLCLVFGLLSRLHGSLFLDFKRGTKGLPQRAGGMARRLEAILEAG